MQWKDEDQILKFAQRLEGHTINEMKSLDSLSEVREQGGKGGFGQYLENAWFGLGTNSFSRPDFYPVPLELKATPLKQDVNNKLVPKERLVLSIINFMEIVHEPSFEESHFLEKNASLLIIWYIHNSARPRSVSGRRWFGMRQSLSAVISQIVHVILMSKRFTSAKHGEGLTVPVRPPRSLMPEP